MLRQLQMVCINVQSIFCLKICIINKFCDQCSNNCLWVSIELCEMTCYNRRVDLYAEQNCEMKCYLYSRQVKSLHSYILNIISVCLIYLGGCLLTLRIQIIYKRMSHYILEFKFIFSIFHRVFIYSHIVRIFKHSHKF